MDEKNDMKCQSFGTGILCKHLYNIVYKNWYKVLQKNRCRISSLYCDRSCFALRVFVYFKSRVEKIQHMLNCVEFVLNIQSWFNMNSILIQYVPY